MKTYTYVAKVTKIVDGDTIDMMFDVGFGIYKAARCRLYGVNTPELGHEDWAKAKAFLKSVLNSEKSEGGLFKVKLWKSPFIGEYYININGVNCEMQKRWPS